MKLRVLLLVALALDVMAVLALAVPAAAQPDPCQDTHVGIGYVPVLDANPCTQGTAYVCVPRNKQGDWNCTPVGLWCWCPGPVIA